MPIPLSQKEPGVVIAPKRDPWSEYQAQMARYQGAPASQTPQWSEYQAQMARYQGAPASQTPQYEVYGSAPQAPTGMGAAPGLGALIGLKLGMSGAGAGGAGLTAAAPAVATGASELAPFSPLLPAFDIYGGTTAASAAAPTATAAPLAASGSLGALPIAGIGLASYLGGKALYDMYKGKKAGLPGRIIAGVATGGLSEIAKRAGWLGHESTRDIARKHTASLLDQGKDNNPWQRYVSAVRAQYDSAPPDPSKPFAGKYGSFDEYKKAGLQADDLTGVYGNLETFGPEWAGYNFDQQKAITQALIDKDQYYSKKGEVLIKDQDVAKSLVAGALANMLKTPSASVRKDSPGFKDGKRISYGAKK